MHDYETRQGLWYASKIMMYIKEFDVLVDYGTRETRTAQEIRQTQQALWAARQEVDACLINGEGTRHPAHGSKVHDLASAILSHQTLTQINTLITPGAVDETCCL